MTQRYELLPHRLLLPHDAQLIFGSGSMFRVRRNPCKSNAIKSKRTTQRFYLAYCWYAFTVVGHEECQRKFVIAPLGAKTTLSWHLLSSFLPHFNSRCNLLREKDPCSQSSSHNLLIEPKVIH